jgi:hypothetical protein
VGTGLILHSSLIEAVITKSKSASTSLQANLNVVILLSEWQDLAWDRFAAQLIY